MVEYIITGNPQREERYDYPIDAIREIVLNMIVHRDYRDSSDSVIKIFDDRIEFFNPGSLPKDIKYILKEEFSMPRNSTIARIFRTIKLSENIGSGFHKMFNGWTFYYKKKQSHI